MLKFERFSLRTVALAAALVAAFNPAARAQDAGAMKARHQSLLSTLASSPFQRPVVLQSRNSASQPSGEVYAVVEHPYRNLGKALQRSDAWCEILTLPANVKRCVVSGVGPSQRLTLAVGRKFDQPLEDTYQLQFDYRLVAADENYLSVQMSADEGPMGTRAYRLSLEAVPLDARRSFVHLSYAYANGFAAQVATSAYLATAGRDKVGFTVTGQDADGNPRYIDGIRGIAERNTMRYFLAIESFLDTQSAPEAQRADQRLRDWFEATERYPRQLHEMALQQYMAMKRREMQLSTTAALLPG